jgi:hypothetical protein
MNLTQYRFLVEISRSQYPNSRQVVLKDRKQDTKVGFIYLSKRGDHENIGMKPVGVGY